MAETGHVVKTETTVSPGEPMYCRTECPECTTLREQLAECQDKMKKHLDGVGKLIEKNERHKRQLAEATECNEQANARIEAMRTRAEAAEALCGEMAAALRQLVAAMRRYEMDVDDIAPPGHRTMMRMADALLATDAAQQALAQREKEQVVIEVARRLVGFRTSDTPEFWQTLCELDQAVMALAAERQEATNG